MRNKNNFITSPKQSNHQPDNELITVIIFEKPSNLKLKTTNFPFIKINGKSLLEKQIDVINSTFINAEIIFVCGNTSLKIFDYIKRGKNSNVRIVENTNFNNSNCCESIRLGLNNTFNNKVLIAAEDTMLNASILNSVDLSSNCILVHDHNNDNNFEIGAIKNDFKLENLTIGIKQNYWTEILFLNNEKTTKEFREILFLDNFRNKLLFEAINHLNLKYNIKTITVPQCIKLNNAKTLKRINAE
jgi:hypothetical protein